MVMLRRGPCWQGSFWSRYMSHALKLSRLRDLIFPRLRLSRLDALIDTVRYQGRAPVHALPAQTFLLVFSFLAGLLGTDHFVDAWSTVPPIMLECRPVWRYSRSGRCQHGYWIRSCEMWRG